MSKNNKRVAAASSSSSESEESEWNYGDLEKIEQESLTKKNEKLRQRALLDDEKPKKKTESKPEPEPSKPVSDSSSSSCSSLSAHSGDDSEVIDLELEDVWTSHRPIAYRTELKKLKVTVKEDGLYFENRSFTNITDGIHDDYERYMAGPNRTIEKLLSDPRTTREERDLILKPRGPALNQAALLSDLWMFNLLRDKGRVDNVGSLYLEKMGYEFDECERCSGLYMDGHAVCCEDDGRPGVGCDDYFCSKRCLRKHRESGPCVELESEEEDEEEDDEEEEKEPSGKKRKRDESEEDESPRPEKKSKSSEAEIDECQECDREIGEEYREHCDRCTYDFCSSDCFNEHIACGCRSSASSSSDDDDD